VLAYLLALLSKPTVMLLPLLFVLLAWWPLRRMERRTVFRMWPHFALSLVFGVITVLSHESTAGFMPHSNEDALPSPLRVCFLVAFYLGKIVRPDPLSCVYPPPPSSPSHPAVLGGVALVGALTIALLALARRARGPLVGWLIFLIALAPTLGVVRYSWVSASDKYLYFPALGLLIVLAWGLARAWASPRRWARGATLMLVLPLLLLEARGVRATLRHWTDSLTLFRQMERVAPRSPVVHAQLGVLLERQGRREEGLVHLHRALKLAPEFPAAHFNLGVVLAREGRLEESIRRFRAAEALSPGSPLTLFNIGLSLRMLGRLDSAEVAFRSALQGKPDYLEALDELGSLLMNRGRPGEAIVELRRAVMLVSGDAARHYRLAAALLIDGGGMEAVRHLREAIRLQPAWPEPLNTLAWLRATSADPALRDTSEALRFAGEALRATRGGDPRVLDTMAAAEASAGRFAAAARRERTAIELAAGSFPDSLVRGMRERLSRYERGEPYREERRTNPPAVRGTR
jgi:Flp pilus assembly protein TadD